MAMNKDQINEIIPLILTGDNEAFEIFYEEYKNIVYLHTKKWIHRINKATLNLYDFEDLENEMWENILRKLPKYDSNKSGMTTWLYMVCGQCPQRIQYTASMAKRSPNEDERLISLNLFMGEDHDTELLNLIADTEINMEDKVVSEIVITEIIYKLKNFLETLNEREQIIYLHSIKGLTLRESGNLLGVSHERIRQLKSRIEERLFIVSLSKRSIDMKSAYSFTADLLSKRTDDELSENLDMALGSVKICREILKKVNLYVTTNI